MNSLSNKIRMKKHIDATGASNAGTYYGHKANDDTIVTLSEGCNRFQLKFYVSSPGISLNSISNTIRVNNSFVQNGDVIYANVTGDTAFYEGDFADTTQVDIIQCDVVRVTDGQFQIVFKPINVLWSPLNICTVDFIVFG